jgi:hypothetical protein
MWLESSRRRAITSVVWVRGCIVLALFGSIVSFAGAAGAGSWRSVAPLPVKRAYHTATLLMDGRVLAAGGTVGGTSGHASSVIYDPTTNVWTATGSLIQGRDSHSATQLADGRVMVSGGARFSRGFWFALGSAEIYDPTTGRWASTGSLSAPRRGHTATLLRDGRVLALGGQNENALYIGAVEIYDPATGAWTRVGTMPAPSLGHTATLLPSGEVLVVGGSNDGGVLSSAHLYDPATNRWTYAGDVGQRAGHTATVVPSPSGGVVLVAGGGAGSPLASALGYALNGSGWRQAATMNAAHSGHFAVRLGGGRVLVAGGFRPPPPELYDAASDRWTIDAAQPMIFGPAVALLDGTVLVAGGIDNQVGNYTREAYVYVPDAWPLATLTREVPALSGVPLLTLAALLAVLAIVGGRMRR